MDLKKIEREAEAFLDGSTDPMVVRLATDLLNTIDALQRQRYIAVIYDGAYPIGLYAIEADSDEEAEKIGADAFGHEYHLQTRWSDRHPMYGGRMEVHRLRPISENVMTNWWRPWIEEEREQWARFYPDPKEMRDG